MATMDLFNLANQHALITGASSGLGRHFAITLAKAGANISIAARRNDELVKTAAAIEALGGRANPVIMNVEDAFGVEQAVKAAEATFGPFSILVNSAGLLGGFKPALDLDEATWDSMIDTNLKGSWLVSKSVGSRMIHQGDGGSIINIASVLGVRVAKGGMHYAVSKAAVVKMTEALAREWAEHGVRVNALAISFFRTEANQDFLDTQRGLDLIKRVPMQRIGDHGELDGPLLLLASRAGSFMTGSVVSVDGGHAVAGL